MVSTASLCFRKRLGIVERLYYGFMAAAATLIFLLVVFILLRASSDIPGSQLWLFVAGAVVTPAAAWYLGRACITGLDLYKIAHPRNELPALIWHAALGDSEAVATLQSARDRLRAEIAQGSGMNEPRCRGMYSVILEQIDRTLKAVSPDNVVPIGGSLEEKQRFITRLETELVNWRADYAWFEKVVDRGTP